MIKLKQYAEPEISLESVVEQLDVLRHVHVSLESYPTYFGLEDVDLKGKLLKVKEVLMKVFEAVAEFIRGLWKKAFGKDEQRQVSQAEANLKEAEKIEPEVTEEVSEAIVELVKENAEPNQEPKVPEGLPKQLCTRLINTHNQYFNKGVSAFRFVTIKENEWYNELPALILDALNGHRVAFDVVINDRDKTLEHYENQVLQSSSYAKLKSVLEKVGVKLEGFGYSQALYDLNAMATHFERSPYLVLDIDANGVYKAKVGELKEGLKQLRAGIKLADSLRTRANQQESSFIKFSKSLNDEDQQQKAKACSKHFTELVKATMVSLRLRQMNFNANIDYIDSVIAVMQHPTFKKGK